MEFGKAYGRTLILASAVVLLLAGLLTAPLHAHDTDSARSCRLCQTERAAEPEDSGPRSGLPTLVDLGAPSDDEPIFEGIDAKASVRGRAPPASV